MRRRSRAPRASIRSASCSAARAKSAPPNLPGGTQAIRSLKDALSRGAERRNFIGGRQKRKTDAAPRPDKFGPIA